MTMVEPQLMNKWSMQEQDRHQTKEETEKEDTPNMEREFAENTTLHGIVRIGNPDKPLWLRIAWILAFLACAGVCIWQISLRVTAYLRYEANTQSSVLYRSSLTFPAVTICNFNRFRASQITADDAQFLQYVFLAEDYDYGSYEESISFSWYGSQFDYYELFGNLSSSFNYTEFTLRAGFVLDNTTLVECNWRGRQCYPENFTHVFTSYGNCYQFNSGVDANGGAVPILSEDLPGVGNGLHVLINIEQDEYTETFSGNREAGLKILVHDQQDPPLMDSLGSALPPGYQAFVGVRKNEYRNLIGPWGDCDKTATLDYYNSYTLSGCFIECQLEHILRECNCRPVRYPGTEEVCSPYEASSCVVDVLKRFKNGDFGQCDCPVACLYTEYVTSLSYGLLPSRSVADDFEQRFGVNASYFRENIVSLDVYYEELNFQVIEQSIAITSDSLISDLGGQLGLFLGASMLTLGEVIEYIVFRIRRFWKSKRKDRRVMSQNDLHNDSINLKPQLFVDKNAKPQPR